MWKCLAKSKAPVPKRMRIGPKTVDYIFIGYEQKSTAYGFLLYDSRNADIHKNTILESNDASFFENVFPYKVDTRNMDFLDHEFIDQPIEKIVEISQDQDNEAVKEFDSEEPRRSKQVRLEKSFGHDFLTYMLEGEPQTY